jgi:hypothetical protein
LGAYFFNQARDEAIFLRGEGVKKVLDLNGRVTLLGGSGLS